MRVSRTGQCLCLGRKAECKERSAKSKDRDFFLHVFFCVSVHSTRHPATPTGNKTDAHKSTRHEDC